MVNIYMVGTVHLDSKGPARLEKFLNMVRPDTIGMECTEESYQTLLEQHEFVRTHPTVCFQQGFKASVEYGPKVGKFIELQLAVGGYELWVPTTFAKQNSGIQLQYCDDYKGKSPNDFVNSVLSDATGEKINEKEMNTGLDIFLRSFSDSSVEEMMEGFYAENSDNIFKIISSEPESIPIQQKMLIERDISAEPKIREAITTAKHTMVYIGGLSHLFGNYHNLYDRLKDLKPVRLKLNEVDKY